MEFAVTMEIDNAANHNAAAVQEFSNLVRATLASKDYGQGLNHFLVGFVCILSRPGYEGWYKERRPRFKAVEPFRRADGTKAELRNVFSYDIKLSNDEFHQFTKANAPDAVRLFADKLLSSLGHFSARRKALADFRTNDFLREFGAMVRECRDRLAPLSNEASDLS